MVADRLLKGHKDQAEHFSAGSVDDSFHITLVQFSEPLGYFLFFKHWPDQSEQSHGICVLQACSRKEQRH